MESWKLIKLSHPSQGELVSGTCTVQSCSHGYMLAEGAQNLRWNSWTNTPQPPPSARFSNISAPFDPRVKPTKEHTVEPQITNAPDHEQFGSRTKFSEQKTSRMTNGVSVYEHASWQQRLATS
jgi:hypothetical protein